jgi:hypothetical protein
VLKELRLPANRDLPPGRLWQRREHLVKELILLERESARPRHAPGRRRRWLALVLAPAAAFGVAAGAYAVIAHSAQDVVDGIGCYSEASTKSDTTVVVADGRDPVEVCAELWEEGIVADHAREAPPLVACVPPEGRAVAVFPGEDGTCEELGMAPLPTGYRKAAERFSAMREDLVRRTQPKSPDDCLGVEGARAIAREVLDAHGFSDWVIEVGPAPSGEGQSCVTVAFDPPNRSVMLLRATGG